MRMDEFQLPINGPEYDTLPAKDMEHLWHSGKRDELANRCIRLALKKSIDFEKRHRLPWLSMLSAAVLGVMYAIDRWDPKKGPLLPYIVMSIGHSLSNCWHYEHQFVQSKTKSTNEDVKRRQDIGVWFYGTQPPQVSDDLDVHEVVDVRDMVEALPDRERECITLRFGLNGRKPMAVADVASYMGISPSAVVNLTWRAKQRLREAAS